MNAAYCTTAGRIEIRSIAEPIPAPHEVVVEVHACGICGSDLHYFDGGFPPPAICPGHEIAGRIVAVGATAGIELGTRVAVEPLVVCGNCPYCRTGNYQLCPQFRIIGNSVDGGFAERVCVPARSVFPLPDEIDFEVGALTEPLAVAVHALRLAQPTTGDSVLVLGAGTIGLMAVAAARAAGAGTIWVTARHPHQEAAARSLGADQVFIGRAGEANLRAQARRDVVDIVVETVGGTAPTIEEAIRYVRRGGKVVVLGIFTQPSRIDATTLVVKEVQLLGSMTYGRAGVRADFERTLDILRRDGERLRTLITHRVALGEIAAGFAAAADKRSGSIKVIVQPNRSA